MEQARAVAKLARMATQKQNATSGKRISPTNGNRISKPKTPLVESVSQDDSKSVSLSISREGSAAGASGQPVLPLRSEPRLIHPKRVGKLRTATAEPQPLPSGLLEWTKPTLTEIKYTDELRKLYRCETSDEAA
jgi:hypothetical protein